MLKIYLIVLLNFTLRKYKFFEFILFIFAQKFKINKHTGILLYFIFIIVSLIFFFFQILLSLLLYSICISFLKYNTEYTRKFFFFKFK